MRSARIYTFASIGLLAGLCGCYHYGYSPYGSTYPYGPAYPATPGGGYMPPSTPYIPGGSPTPMGPTPTPQPNWNPAPGGGSAPTYESPSGNSKGTVPYPTDSDDNNKSFGAPPGASNQPAAPGGISGSGIQLQPIEPGASTPTGTATPSTSVAINGGDPFEVPAKSVSSGATVTAKSPGAGEGSARPNPFAHDARNFSWMRGIIDFDPQDRRWMMIYSANPSPSDRYGGSITLNDHADLDRIKPGDVVLIEGAVDADSLDQHGKPLYRIDKLQPLKPKN